MKKIIRNFFNGMAFGITETVPGVSGGTIAIILGFYDELIKTINNFRKDYKKSLKFLAPLLLGIAAGVLIFTSIINYLLGNFSLPTMCFFIGLIIGIIPLIYLKTKDREKKIEFKKIGLIIFPALLLVVMSYFKGDSITNPAEFISSVDILFMLFIFFAGIIAAMALVIPGVSGSFVLLLMGIYPLITYSVSLIRLWITDITNTALLLSICKVLVPLAIGVIIGGLTMVKLIERLLERHYKNVYSIILGLLIGSIYVLFKEPLVYQSGTSTLMIIIGILTFLSGGAASFFIGRKRF
jgi:putative membrane protein